METIKIKLFFVCLALIASVASCTKSDNKVSCNSGFTLYAVTSEEIQTLSDAALKYSQDPSTTNCERYKNALNDYVDELGKYEKCAFETGQGPEWNQALQETKKSIQDIQCQ